MPNPILLKTQVQGTHVILKKLDEFISEVPYIGEILKKIGSVLFRDPPNSKNEPYHGIKGFFALVGTGLLLGMAKPYFQTSDDSRRLSGNKRSREFLQFMRKFNMFSEAVIQRGCQIVEKIDSRGLTYEHQCAITLYYLSLHYDLGVHVKLRHIVAKTALLDRYVHKIYRSHEAQLVQFDQSISSPILSPISPRIDRPSEEI